MKIKIAFFIMLSFQCRAQNWSHESGVNIITISGDENVKTETYKQLSIFNVDDIKVQFKGEYLKSLDSEIWSASTRFDKSIWFASQEWLGNNPKRTNSDLGAKYNSYEFGYRLQRENKVNTHFFRFYAGFSKVIWFFESKITIEILPSVLEVKNIQTNIEPTFSIALSRVFSLTVSYLHKYNSRPELIGEKVNTIYKTTLVAKY